MADPQPATPSPAGYIVRHGLTRVLGEFTPPEGQLFDRGGLVVLKTERGQEVGEVLCRSTPAAVAQLPDAVRGTIVRGMPPEDRERLEAFRTRRQKEFDSAAALIANRRLQMQLV